MSEKDCEKKFNELFEEFKKTGNVETGWIASYYGILAGKYGNLVGLFSRLLEKVDERYIKTFYFFGLVFQDDAAAVALRSFLLEDCDFLIVHLRIIEEENTEKKETMLYNYFAKHEKDKMMLKAFARFFGAYPKEFRDALLLLRK